MTPRRAAGVLLNGRLICADAAEALIVARALPEHLRLTRAEAGCLWFTVVQSDDPLIWTVDEGFADRAAFDAHQARTRCSDWYAQTKDIQRDFTLRDANRDQLSE